MVDVFVSYAHEDRDRVEPIVRALERIGWSVWWDPKGRAGADLETMVSGELDNAKSLLVVWSKHSVVSDWVIGEADVGRVRRILLPVAIDPVTPPLRFRNSNTVSLENWNGSLDSQEFMKVAEGIKFYAYAPTGDPSSLQIRGYEIALDRLDRGVASTKFFSILNSDDPINILASQYGWKIGAYEFWEGQYYYLRVSHPDVAAGRDLSITRVFEMERLKKRQPENWQQRVARMAPLMVLDYSYCQLLEDEFSSVGGLLYHSESNSSDFYAPFCEWSPRLSRLLQLLPRQ